MNESGTFSTPTSFLTSSFVLSYKSLEKVCIFCSSREVLASWFDSFFLRGLKKGHRSSARDQVFGQPVVIPVQRAAATSAADTAKAVAQVLVSNVM